MQGESLYTPINLSEALKRFWSKRSGGCGAVRVPYCFGSMDHIETVGR